MDGELDIGPWLVVAAILLGVWRLLRRGRARRPARASPEAGGITIGPVHLPAAVATQGLVCFGQPGSGKSHFLLSKIRELARARQPMVITTVRQTDYADIERIFREEGRLDMLRRSCPGSDWRMNPGRFFSDPKFLPGASPRLLAHALSMANEVMNDSAGGRQQDEFWQGFYHEMTLMAARLLILARGHVNLADLYEIVMSVPGGPREAASDRWLKTSFCGRMLAAASADRPAGTDRDYEQVVNFFIIKVAGVGTKAKSAVQQMATNALAGLISDEFHQSLCTDTTITPRIVEQQKLAWILDYPLMVWHGSGRVYQFLHTAAVDFWCMARDPATVDSVFWKIRDEAGWICNAGHDVSVQAVSRAQKLASAIAVQNLPLLETQLGGGQKGKQEALALVSVHNTRLFFKNSCPETGEYASKLSGDFKELLVSGGGCGQESSNWIDAALGVRPGSLGWAEHWEPRLRKEACSALEVGTCFMHGHNGTHFIDMRKRA